jgi:hypothetical protein
VPRTSKAIRDRRTSSSGRILIVGAMGGQPDFKKPLPWNLTERKSVPAGEDLDVYEPACCDKTQTGDVTDRPVRFRLSADGPIVVVDLLRGATASNPLAAPPDGRADTRCATGDRIPTRAPGCLFLSPPDGTSSRFHCCAACSCTSSQRAEHRSGNLGHAPTVPLAVVRLRFPSSSDRAEEKRGPRSNESPARLLGGVRARPKFPPRGQGGRRIPRQIRSPVKGSSGSSSLPRRPVLSGLEDLNPTIGQ